MRVLYVEYTLWKSIVQDQSFAIYEETVDTNQVRAWAGADAFVYRTDVSSANYTDYTTAFPSGRTAVSGEDEAIARIVNFKGPQKLATYYASAQLVGPSGGGPSGSNKAMLSLLNPGGSGKTLSVRIIEYFPLGSVGTDVYIDLQVRAITAHSAGTAVTIRKRSSADPASVAEVKSAPNVTGGAAADLMQQLVMQSNAPSGGRNYRFHFGDQDDEKPIMLEPGEGLVLHQVTSNGGNFAPGLVWIEI